MKPQKFTTRIQVLSHLPGMHYLEIPKKIIAAFGGKFPIRVVCSVNKKLSFQAGLVALGAGKGYISITKARLKILGAKAGDKADVELKPDTSKFGMPVPEELSEVLRQDPEGQARFAKLTPGRQRYIIHYVNSVKNTDKRIDRALLLIGNLKLLPAGKESFRGMLGK